MITKAILFFFILYILYSYGGGDKYQWHEHALTVPVRLAIAIVTGEGLDVVALDMLARQKDERGNP